MNTPITFGDVKYSLNHEDHKKLIYLYNTNLSHHNPTKLTVIIENSNDVSKIISLYTNITSVLIDIICKYSFDTIDIILYRVNNGFLVDFGEIEGKSIGILRISTSTPMCIRNETVHMSFLKLIRSNSLYPRNNYVLTDTNLTGFFNEYMLINYNEPRYFSELDVMNAALSEQIYDDECEYDIDCKIFFKKSYQYLIFKPTDSKLLLNVILTMKLLISIMQEYYTKK